MKSYRYRIFIAGSKVEDHALLRRRLRRSRHEPHSLIGQLLLAGQPALAFQNSYPAAVGALAPRFQKQ